MAKKVSTAKKVTKKRVKKNVERGQAVWDLEVQGNLLHMQHRWLQKLQLRQLLYMV